MRDRYNEQLMNLNKELTLMGDLCKAAITFALSSMSEYKVENKEKVVELENEINQKERTIEQCCMKIILQQQPVATDLRKVSSALKMISDMERIGDQAYDIAMMLPISLKRDTRVYSHVLEMASRAIIMVSNSVESFVSQNLEMAHDVMNMDDEIDDYFTLVKRELVDSIATSQLDGEILLDLFMIAKYLERIGDHCTNIAEWVEYSITGNFKKPSIKSEI